MFMLKALAFGVVALLIAAAASAVWVYRFSGPSITTWEKDGSLFVANVHLGEYYLGISEVTITDRATGTQLLHASSGEGNPVGQINLGPRAGIAAELRRAGWDVVEPDGECVVDPGISLRVRLRGNNGFGYYNSRSITVTIPQVEATTSGASNSAAQPWLQAEVTAPPSGFRFPTDIDRTDDWETFKEQIPTPFRAVADFNGDGIPDEAWILLSESQSGWGLFVFLRQPDAPPQVVKLDEDGGRTAAQRLGLAVVDPGRYKTACGKGYWDCDADEPDELTLVLPAIDFFTFESANSFFWWDKPSQQFKRTWMSD